MRVLVTGGAGFIGAHTCARLQAEGHDVVVLDAMTAPVHLDVHPSDLGPDVEFHLGDVRDRDLVSGLLRRVDAVYHLAAYQDHLTDFARFFDVNVTATALLYELVAAGGIELGRVVVASSQAAVGEGLYRCAVDGEQVPEMRTEAALAAGRWDLACPECGGPLQLLDTPERVAKPQNAYGMSKFAEETVALNLGRRYGIPTVALRYSIVQGPGQSVTNAYSGACRIFCLHYRQGLAPTLFEDGEAVRDYVNIDDVVDANVLALHDERAVGRVLNVGGGVHVTTRQLADLVMEVYGSEQRAEVTGEYRFGDTRHAVSDTSALRALGWAPRRGMAESVKAYASWLDDLPDPGSVLADAAARMRALGVVRRAGP